MRMQSTQNNCGPASLANAFRAIGRDNVTEDKVVVLMRKHAPASDAPEQDGAGVRPLQAAAGSLGYSLVPFKFEHPGMAWAFVRHTLSEGKPSLLCIDDNSHWVTAIGLVGDAILVADPAHAEIVTPMAADTLTLRWAPDYYMMVLVKTPRKRKK